MIDSKISYSFEKLGVRLIQTPTYFTEKALRQEFKEIIDASEDGRIQFLFGAGMSAGSNLPTAYRLLKNLLEDHLEHLEVTEEQIKEIINGFPFEAIIQALENRYSTNREKLTEKLIPMYVKDSYDFTKAHKYFKEILFDSGKLIVDRILTTNFDLIFEKLLGDNISYSICEENYEKINGDTRIPIIHLHGMLDGNKHYQITERDLITGITPFLKGEFELALYKDVFVFVGFSLNDTDFKTLYINFRENFERRTGKKRKTYVVSPAEDELAYLIGKEVWETRNVTWLPLTAEEFFSNFRYLINNKIHSDNEKQLKKKYEKKYIDIKTDNDKEKAINEYIEKIVNSVQDKFGLTREDAVNFILKSDNYINK